MPLSNLRKSVLLDTDITENSREMQRLVDLCHNKPLYYSWHPPKHERQYQKTNGNCCIWHILGPETKDGHEMPMLPYQSTLFNALRENRQVWIKKARGVGLTTFMLYYIAYLSLTRLQPGDRICIVVGPNQRLAEDIILRVKNLFLKKFPDIYSELLRQGRTYAIVAGTKIECFASHNFSGASVVVVEVQTIFT